MSPEKAVFFFAKFNLPALLNRAGQLRGLPCSCDELKRPESGALNWAIILSFEDGVEWIFRSPVKSHEIASETAAELLESEVATMKYVKCHSLIPVPEVFDYSSTNFNAVGIPFILMSKAPGHALSDCAWDVSPAGFVSPRKPRHSISSANKKKIMQQLGVICSQLSNLRFDTLGSLFEQDGRYGIKKCLSPALLWHSRDSLSDAIPRGPFNSSDEYYESLLSAFLIHMEELPIQRSVFFAPIPEVSEYETLASYRSAVGRWNDFVSVGSKIDCGRNRLDYCTAGHFLRKMIPLIGQLSRELPLDVRDGYALYHPDLSTSNIFVDDDFNITSIIDWAFASTVPLSSLLMTPSFPHPRDEIDPALIPIFRASFTEHFSKGNANAKLFSSSSFWDSTRRAWLFTRLVTLDGLQDYRYFTELYASVYKTESCINITKLFKDLQRKADFIELAAVLTEDDRSANEIKKDETEYFRLSQADEEAVARKLTVMAGLSQGFVADRRLWRWIEEATVCSAKKV